VEDRNVLRIITRLNIGGPARQALTLTEKLSSDFPTVLVTGTPDPEEGELSDPGVQITRVPLVRPIRPRGDMDAFGAVRGIIRELRPALLHSHMAKAGTIGRLAAILAKPKPVLVHTFHGHVLDGYFSSPVSELFLRMERYLARRTDALVAVSDEIRDELLELGIGAPEQWRVIPLGFDLSGFVDHSQEQPTPLRGELRLGDDSVLLGIVGRLVPIKDHATALRALARLPDHVHLAIVGDGEERAKVQGLVNELRLGDRAHFLGWRMNMPEVMSSFDTVILSSRNEGSPVALIEALAAGVPVVATDVGGVRSVVSEGISGHLVPAGDDAAMAEAISGLLADPNRRRVMGAAGREYVLQRFDQARLVSDIRSLYEELLERRA
jgi:glycosyltransferase involved in cell wall biosynthesis